MIYIDDFVANHLNYNCFITRLLALHGGKSKFAMLQQTHHPAKVTVFEMRGCQRVICFLTTFEVDVVNKVREISQRPTKQLPFK